MDPRPRPSRSGTARLPRSRGDGPCCSVACTSVTLAAPLTRGWTPTARACAAGRPGCPAHAGMDRLEASCRPMTRRLPRSRGDGPPELNMNTYGDIGCPAHAGMDPTPARRSSRPHRLPRSRGDGPVSLAFNLSPRAAAPLTRGWTRHQVLGPLTAQGCPAHAGMDPPRSSNGPLEARLPRSRGDGPDPTLADAILDRAAPLTRGWTPAAARHHARSQGCPAHAGMDPHDRAPIPSPGGLPRSRGDGPLISSATV
ncbi:MAG: hypothetical protein RL223_4247 [Pseudomonadota bacterium]